MNSFKFSISFFILTCHIFLLFSQKRGDVISYTFEQQLTIPQLENIVTGTGIPLSSVQLDYPINIYKVVYYTPQANSPALTIASGLFMIPDADCTFPLVEYCHGTLFYDQEISNFTAPEWQTGAIFASYGYAVVVPDYLGMGETPISIPQSYLHAQSEASASVDMLIASKIVADREDVILNGQTFLFGSSQGGHTVLATKKELQESYSKDFRIEATAAISGPYDLAGVSLDYALEEAPRSAFFLGFVLTSYQYIYGNIWNSPSDVFVPPYDVIIPNYFNRANPQTNVTLPDTAVRMLQPAFTQDVKTNPLNPFNIALKDNNIYRWAPDVRLRMYYCESDDLVPFQNSIIARDTMSFLGAPQVSAISTNPNLNHDTCGIPSVLDILTWFDSLREPCTQYILPPGESCDCQ